MNFLLLIIAIIILLFSLRKMSMMKYLKSNFTTKEVKQNVISLCWGIVIFCAILFIPYQVWVLTGKSHYFDAVYIIGGTALITTIISFIFYYKSLKYN